MVKNLINILILCVIFFLRLPAFNIFSDFFNRTTHSLAIFFILIISFKALLDKRVKKINGFDKVLFLLILTNILALSLSIIHAVNLISYFKKFKDYLISFLLFIIISIYFKKKDIKKIINTLLFATAISLLLQIISYLNPVFFNFFINFIHPQGSKFIEYQSSRNRFFGEFLDEVMFPIIFFLMLRTKNKNIFFSYLSLISLIIIITIVSNWRTKQLILLFSIFLLYVYFFIYKSKIKFMINNFNRLKFIFISFFILLFFLLSYLVSLNLTGQNSFTRIIFPTELDIKSIESRLNMFKDAFLIGKDFPLTGVGLGNFYDYWFSKEKNSIKLSLVSFNDFPLIDDPHNIFATLFVETGLFGLLSYFFLIAYLFFSDINKLLLTRKNYMIIFVIFSSWSLFLFSLSNPIGFSYLSLFWILRAIIYKLS